MIIDDIAFAKEFARRAHARQLYGDGPYMYHLEQVAQLVAPLYRSSTAAYGDIAETSKKREQLMVIAFLHDVIEDTVVTYDTLAVMFDRRVANAVQLISDPKAHNRKERKRLLYIQLSDAEHQQSVWLEAVTVKVADRLANVVNSARSAQPGADWRLRMYQKEHAEFRRQLHRDGMCDGLWESLDGWIESGEGKER